MSVNGKVIPHTPLAVDFWQVRKCPGTRLFFLSHMHSDHTVGLTSTWSNRPIYCSPVTATLLTLKLHVKEQWIHPLELGEPYSLPLDDIGKEKMTVTLLDANHCPGAVMFLFEGYFGSILYTGDFRYSPSMLRELCVRASATVDVLYLDNTNCDPNRNLPSRHQATQQIKELIRSHPDHDVVIGLFSLGKESLLVELAMEFKTWIQVSVEKMETLKALELPDVFTTESGVGRIHAVDQTVITSSNLRRWDSEQPTLAILPTSRPLVSFHPKLHVVPYSDHSSYTELAEFVSFLKPATLIPIVGKCIPGSLSALLPRKKHHEILVPESVQQSMSRQTKSVPSLSDLSSFRRRCVPPPVPKGVVFESPEKSSRESTDASDEEMDTDSSDKESDYILVDFSTKVTPNKTKRPIDPWSLRIVQTVSEEMLLEQSVPFSQLTQSNFGPVELMTNTRACLRPVESVAAYESARAVNVPEASKTCSQDRQERSLHNSYTLSNLVCMNRFNGQGIHDADVTQSNGHTTQYDGHGENGSVTSVSPRSSSRTLFKDLSEIPYAYLEEIENRLLKDLPFTNEDFERSVLLEMSLAETTSTVCDANVDSLSDDDIP